MTNTFHQTNNPGSIGTQGQVGDNILNVSNANDALQPLRDELLAALQGKEWHDAAPRELTDEFATPATMIDVALTQAQSEIIGKDSASLEPEPQSIWIDRLKSLIPVGKKVASSAAMAVLATYSPVSPILAAISKSLIESLETDNG
tara:strand:+ start:5679 stop:6116 length:438 start_codon:yes stop_codon:yes gene_type:complete